MDGFMIYTLHHIIIAIEETGTYNTNWRDEKCVRNLSWKSLNIRNHLGDLDVDGRIIFK
jgi:hypothetical protein